MQQLLLIPDKLKIGFQKRTDTYTQKLAYVVYLDDKGKTAKERSWNSWSDKNIDILEVENEPTEGFVLNKKIGGYKSDWNFRSAKVRVYDPRGFEFEISINNLLYILETTNSYKGKGLEGKFVYSWDRQELFLLPVDSALYEQAMNYSDNKKKKVVKKELEQGKSYVFEDLSVKKFIDYRDVATYSRYFHYHGEPFVKSKKSFIFLNKDNKFEFFSDLKRVKKLFSDEVSDYQSYIYFFNNIHYYHKPTKIEFISKNSLSKELSKDFNCFDRQLYLDKNYRGYDLSKQIYDINLYSYLFYLKIKDKYFIVDKKECVNLDKKLIKNTFRFIQEIRVKDDTLSTINLNMDHADYISVRKHPYGYKNSDGTIQVESNELWEHFHYNTLDLETNSSLDEYYILLTINNIDFIYGNKLSNKTSSYYSLNSFNPVIKREDGLYYENTDYIKAFNENEKFNLITNENGE